MSRASLINLQVLEKSSLTKAPCNGARGHRAFLRLSAPLPAALLLATSWCALRSEGLSRS
ncbi:hypothetical protein OAO87_01315 [bacterium]|nr:hypothetical protein [bacterium]